jgi:hypothetical protein
MTAHAPGVKAVAWPMPLAIESIFDRDDRLPDSQNEQAKTPLLYAAHTNRWAPISGDGPITELIVKPLRSPISLTARLIENAPDSTR